MGKLLKITHYLLREHKLLIVYMTFFYLTFAAIGDEMFQKKKKKIENPLYCIRNGEF